MQSKQQRTCALPTTLLLGCAPLSGSHTLTSRHDLAHTLHSTGLVCSARLLHIPLSLPHLLQQLLLDGFSRLLFVLQELHEACHAVSVIKLLHQHGM